MSNAEPPGTAAGAITVRGLSGELKARLRIRAAHNARSMEAEARTILEAALRAPEEDSTDLATFVRRIFAPLGGVELELPARTPARDPPDFGSGEAAAPGPAERRAEPSGRPAPRERPVRSPAAERGRGRKA